MEMDKRQKSPRYMDMEDFNSSSEEIELED